MNKKKNHVHYINSFENKSLIIKLEKIKDIINCF